LIRLLAPQTGDAICRRAALARPLEEVPVRDLTSQACEALATSIATLGFDDLEAVPYGDLAPRVFGDADGAFSLDLLPVRISNNMRRRGIERRGQLAQLSTGDVLGWWAVGRASARELLETLIGAELKMLANGETVSPERQLSNSPSEENGRPAASAPLEDAQLGVERLLSQVAAWAAGETDATTLSEALQRAAMSEPRPTEVASASRSLEAIDLRVLGRPCLPVYDPMAAIERILGVIDDRARTVLIQRTLALSHGRKLADLGADLSLSRERVRQVEVRGIKSVRKALWRDENAVVRRVGARIRAQIGAAAPLRAVLDSKELQRITPGWTVDDPAATLLLWVAGPYVERGGWVVFADTEPEGASRAALDLATGDGPIEELVAETVVEGLGIRGTYAREWIVSIGGFRLVDGYVVRWRGSLADKAAVILQMIMKPMTREEILERIAEPRSAGSLANALMADPRFKRTGVHHFGLADWEHDEYTTISDEIAQEIARQGGEASLEHLVEYVSTTYGASPTSVRAYAVSHRFVPTPHGTIRERTMGDTSDSVARPIEFSKSVFRGSSGYALRLRVSDQTLRGSGTMIPAALARAVGVLPGERRVFASLYGDVALGWPSLSPTMSTVREAAEALGATEGDYLFVEFGMDGEARFRVAHRADVEAAEGEVRLASEVGLGGGEGGSTITAIAEALGMSGEPPPSRGEIRQRLRARGEEDLAALVGTSEGAHRGESEDDLMETLLRTFGGRS
jgi:hypothetical protein